MCQYQITHLLLILTFGNLFHNTITTIIMKHAKPSCDHLERSRILWKIETNFHHISMSLGLGSCEFGTAARWQAAVLCGLASAGESENTSEIKQRFEWLVSNQG